MEVSIFRVSWSVFEFCILLHQYFYWFHMALLTSSFHAILFFLPLWDIYFCFAIIDMIKTNAYWVYWVRSVILLFFTSSLERVLNHFCQVLETDPVWILGLNIYINLGKITVFAEYLPVTDKIHNFKQNNNNVTVRKPGWLITEGEIEKLLKELPVPPEDNRIGWI